MAVDTAYAPKRVGGDGAVVAFTFAFRIFATSDITCKKMDANNVAALQTEGSGNDYTVVIDTINGGGTVTYSVAPTATEDSLIELALPYTQTNEFPEAGKIPKSTIQNTVDKNTLLIGQLLARQNNSIEMTVENQTANSQFVFALPAPPAATSGARALFLSNTGLYLSDTDLSDIDTSVAAASASATSALSSATAASAAALNAFSSSWSHRMEWYADSTTTAVVLSQSNFRGVTSELYYEFQSNLTINVAGSVGTALALQSGAVTSSSNYYIVALGDSTGAVNPSAWLVLESIYESDFEPTDSPTLPSGFDDWKRIGNLTTIAGASTFFLDSMHDGKVNLESAQGGDARTLTIDSTSFVNEEFSNNGGIPRFVREVTIQTLFDTAADGNTFVTHPSSGLSSTTGGTEIYSDNGAEISSLERTVPCGNAGANTYVRARTTTGSITPHAVGYIDKLNRTV